MAWTRETPWRQGNVISPADAVALGLTKNGDEKTIAVVISHDCDLAVEDLSEEPFVEVILGRRIPQGHGNYSFAKHPRRLHLDFTHEGAPASIELTASARINVPKSALANTVPDSRFSVPVPGLRILQSWLSSRYRRQALPDELVERLRAVWPKLEKTGKANSAGIIGFWLDFAPDDNHLSQGELYEVWLNVVYSVDDPEHEKGAIAVAEILSTAFAAEFKKDGKWNLIELRRCEAVSERNFTLRDMRETVEYKLEHLSLRADPQAPTSPE